MSRLFPPRVLAARCRIAPEFLDSPVVSFAWDGCEVVLKDETANPVHCFKGRGASHYLATRGSAAPLVCASAGNFGLGLAHACAARGVSLTVFVSRHANPAKVAGIRALGAAIEVAGEDFDAAKDAARRFAREGGVDFVEDGEDLAITEGAGTLGIEVLEACPAPDAVLLPLGNGALLAGVGGWIKHAAPGTQVIGVVARGAPAMRDAWLGRTCVPARVDTIADGIAVRVPVPAAVDDLRGVMDDVLVVDDADLLRAMRALHALTGLQAEPSAVAGLAAITTAHARFAGQRIATALTGANLTAAQQTAWFTGASP